MTVQVVHVNKMHVLFTSMLNIPRTSYCQLKNSYLTIHVYQTQVYSLLIGRLGRKRVKMKKMLVSISILSFSHNVFERFSTTRVSKFVILR